jgi:hypothetical protein
MKRAGGMVRSEDGHSWIWHGNVVKRQRRSVRSEIPGVQFYPAKNMTIQLYEQDTCELAQG